MADTGADAVILITNRLAKEEENDEVWMKNCQKLLERINQDVALGFYECPYPYKRLLTPDTIKWCADTGRFYFLKDTCCDMEQIQKKLDVIQGTNLEAIQCKTQPLCLSH